MKSLIKVEVPLTLPNETVIFGPQCAFCGKPVVEPGSFLWEEKIKYTGKHWARGKKFQQMELWDDNDLRTVTLRVPYCSQHAKKPKTFNPYIFFGTIIIITLLLNFVIYSFLPSESRNIGDQWFGYLFFTLLLGIPIGNLLGWLINNLVFSKKTENRDFPAWRNKGFWGLVILGHRMDSGKDGIGPIQYFLDLGFSSVESAERFLKSFPAAKVLLGEELLKE